MSKSISFMILEKQINLIEVFGNVIGVGFIDLFWAQNLFSISYPKLLQLWTLSFKLIEKTQ